MFSANMAVRGRDTPEADNIILSEVGKISPSLDEHARQQNLEITIPNQRDDDVIILEPGELWDSEEEEEKPSEEKAAGNGQDTTFIVTLLKDVYSIPKEISRRDRPPSVHILNDGRLIKWPKNDNKCLITIQPTWLINDWINNLRDGNTRIGAFNVVISLDSLRLAPDVNPLKNQISSLCRAIRAITKDTRIYVCDNIPRPFDHSPLGLGVEQHNSLIRLAAKKANNRKLRKVFGVRISRYFKESEREDHLEREKYFEENNCLTKWGCLHLRTVLFRELGLCRFDDL